MNKAIIYKRISTRLSRQDIERQQAPIENFCKNKGFEIIGQFGDDVSGTVCHSKAMHLLQAGVNLIYIRDILGHTSFETTEI